MILNPQLISVQMCLLKSIFEQNTVVFIVRHISGTESYKA